MSDEIYSAQKMITETVSSLFKNISSEKMRQSKDLSKKWETILLSIKSSVIPDCGQKMLDHSRIIDIENEIMIIEIDHPGWMQLFETYRSYILKGIQLRIPELNIKTLSYKLRKKDNPNTARLISREEAEKALERQNVAQEKTEDTDRTGESKKLPPELEAIFSRFRESILTNN